MENVNYEVAEVEVSYRPKFKAIERPKISSSDQAYKLFLNQWNLDKIQFQEEFKIMLLNRRNNVLGIADISMGGLSGTFVDPKIVFCNCIESQRKFDYLVPQSPKWKS